uniref:F-box domain-containing protein n=1 Tax=Steinernema glaseri TaxID=37863 RepID=A0A1I7YUJ1_9BILA
MFIWCLCASNRHHRASAATILPMDYLGYDLVEEIVGYLPPEDVDVISRVAAESPGLPAWSLAADEQLEKRFLLDIHISIDEEDDKKKSPTIRLSAVKILSDELEEVPWNFTQWRYAAIRNITIKPKSIYDTHQGTPTDLKKVLRIVSLPVDHRAEGSLSVTGDARSPAAGALVWKILRATQKLFVKVHLTHLRSDPSGAFEDFVADYIDRGVFLDDLRCFGDQTEQNRICAAVAPLFGRKRGRPLTLMLSKVRFEFEDIERILEEWLKSDGAYEDKKLGVRAHCLRNAAWRTITDKFNFVGNAEGGFIAHPMKRSSLHITRKTIHVVRYQRWHDRVDFRWIESVINRWKHRSGRYLLRGEKRLSIVFSTTGDSDKFIGKYGPMMTTSYPHLTIDHPSDKPVYIAVAKKTELFDICVRGWPH